MDMSLSKLREIVKGREACHAAVHGVAKSRTRLNDWPVQVQCTMLDAWGWCAGTAQGDGMGRGEGGGFRMGSTCIPEI